MEEINGQLRFGCSTLSPRVCSLRLHLIGNVILFNRLASDSNLLESPRILQ